MQLRTQRKILRERQTAAVAQPCLGTEVTRGCALPETRACSYGSLGPRAKDQINTVCGPCGDFLCPTHLLASPARPRGSAVTVPGAGAGYARHGFGAGGAARQPRGESCRTGRPYPAGLPATRTHVRPPGSPAAAGLSRCRQGLQVPRGRGRRPPRALCRPPGGEGPGERRRGPAIGGGRTAIGARRGQCRPAPPRRGFITGIPMAEAGNLLPRDRRCRTARESRLCWPQSRAAPRDDDAAGLAQRGGSPVPAGAAAGASAAGSQPPGHGAPGK